MSRVLDALYPKYCCVCNRYGQYLCDTCKKRFKRNLPECYICRRLSPQYITHAQCRSSNTLNSVFVGWEYNALSSKILKLFKYRNVRDISDEISKLLIECILNSCYNPLLKNTLLIPVPISYGRITQRGFNQTELIAQNISKTFNIDLSTSIIASKNSKQHQAERSKEARLANTSNPFYIREYEDIGKYNSITLVDDVITTGKTLENIATILRRYYDQETVINAICLFRGKPYYL